VHAAHQYHFGPGQIEITQSLHIGVHKPLLPLAKQNSAATVIRPSGCCVARLPTNLSACLRLR
jgi:hypothetical protein